MEKYKYYPDTKIFRGLYPKGELVEGKIKVEIPPNMYEGVFTAPVAGTYALVCNNYNSVTVHYYIDKGEKIDLGGMKFNIYRVG